MAHIAPNYQTAASIPPLCNNLQSNDPDIRFMALNDLNITISNGMPNLFAHDVGIAMKVAESLLQALQDKNGEVQNMAVKCLTPFVIKVGETVLCPLVDKLASIPADAVVDASIPSLALRTIVLAMPRPAKTGQLGKDVQEAYNTISRAVLPRLVGEAPPGYQPRSWKHHRGLIPMDMQLGRDSGAVDVLTEVARCFGPMLNEMEVAFVTRASTMLIQHNKTSHVLRKKAVATLSAIAPYMSDKMLANFIATIMDDMRIGNLPNERKKNYYSLIASVARVVSEKFGAFIPRLIPFALQTLSDEEIAKDVARLQETEERDPEVDEVRETALLAIESWLVSCPEAMRPYTAQTIQILQRFMKYEPNLVDFDDEIDEDEASLDGEDFEEDFGGDDEEDLSWKVRRCAAKVAYALISTRSNGDLLEDGTLYTSVAPALVSRFKEPEETVRLDVLAALSLLVQITSGQASISGSRHDEGAHSPVMGPPRSRKRRRGGSDASMFDSQTNSSLSAGFPQSPSAPSANAVVSLESISAEITQGVIQQLRNAPLPSKKAAVGLLRDVIVCLQGKLSNYLPNVIEFVLSAVNQSSTKTGPSGSSSATTNAFKIEALDFLSSVAEVEAPKTLQPHVGSIVSAILVAMKDKYIKVPLAALECANRFIDLLTPPRLPGHVQWNQGALQMLNSAILDLISDNDLDLEIRTAAIHSLALLLGRSSGTIDLLSPKERATGMKLIVNRLTNETTRLPAARAVDTIAKLDTASEAFPDGWVIEVTIPLSLHLRKASRTLRDASILALRSVCSNPACQRQIDSHLITQLLPVLYPLVKSGDLHSLSSTMRIFASLVERDSDRVVDDDFIQMIALVMSYSLSPNNLSALLDLIRAVGQQGVGRDLMFHLLQKVSLKLPNALVGKAIATLLVHGGPSVSINLSAFVNELNGNHESPNKRCLALAILGEVANLTGPSCELTPAFFLDYFDDTNEQVQFAAAAALGRAGCGAIPQYLGKILESMQATSIPDHSRSHKSSTRKSLFLHTIRELLQTDSTADIVPYAQILWEQIMAASSSLDTTHAVGGIAPSDPAKDSTAAAATRGAAVVGAECLGRIALLNVEEFFPQLRYLAVPSSSFETSEQSTSGKTAEAQRGLALAAIRTTMSSAAKDTLVPHAQVVPLIRDVCGLMPMESSLENEKVGLMVLNAAAHGRWSALKECLAEVTDVVIAKTKIRLEFVREVAMGPFKHRVDDGLEVRKAAFSLLYTLISHALLPARTLSLLVPSLTSGIGDEHDIRIISLLSLDKAMELHTEAVAPLLPQFVDPFREVFKLKLKETAVKEEVERLAEARRAVVKAGILAQRTYPMGLPPEWTRWWEECRAEYKSLVLEAEND